MVINKGFIEKIDNNLNLKISTGTKNDYERIIKINSKVHGTEIKDFTRSLCFEHPNKDDICWFFIENNDELVSSMAFLPLEWLFQDITLKIAEMGMVGTIEQYRGQGLFGKMNKVYEQALLDDGYFISALRGIPYYYRKFGYEFLLPLNQRVILPSDKIPNDTISNLRIRKANRNDIPAIKEMYEINYRDSLILHKFDILNFADKYISDEISEFKFSTYIIEGSELDAFFSVGSPFGASKDLILLSEMTRDQMIKCFQFLKTINEKEIVIDQNLDTTISNYTVDLGGQKNIGWEWQVKILSLQKFFEAIKPVLEKRINSSKFAKLSKIIEISDYRENIKIEFNDGLIAKIETYRGYPDEKTCDLRIPGTMLVKLLFSYKSIKDIKQLVPDAMVKSGSEELIDILYPKMQSYPGSYY